MNGNPRIGIKVLLVALAWVALPLFADQQSAPTVRHHRVEEESDDPAAAEISQAETAMQNHDYSAAEELLKNAVAKNPHSYQAWFDLGYVYNATKRTPDAIDAYRKSVEAKPDVFESNLNLGILLARQGDATEAAKYLSAATQLKPTANTNEGLARAWLSLGLVEEPSSPQQALTAYAQAAKLAPNDPEPHLSAALLLEKQGKLDDAAREYQAAAAFDPKSTEPVTGLANVYTRQKKFADAETQLRKLVAMDPGNETARLQLGRVLAAEGKSEEAAAILGPGNSSSTGDPHAALDLGTVDVKAGNYPAAEEQFRIAIEGMPQDAEAHYALGSVLMEQKRYTESQEELLYAARLKPDLAGVYGNLAVVAAENKNYTLAIRALDERAKYLPESAATYFLRATSYDNLKVTAKAVENYKQFLAVDGGKMANQEWQARHRLIAIDPGNASKYVEKK
jgi:Flp pilus assembly protein TadD